MLISFLSLILSYIIVRDTIYILNKRSDITLLFYSIPLCSDSEIELISTKYNYISSMLCTYLLYIDNKMTNFIKFVKASVQISKMFIDTRTYRLFELYNAISDNDTDNICICDAYKLLHKLDISKQLNTCPNNQHKIINKYKLVLYIIKEYKTKMLYDDKIMQNIDNYLE